MKTVQGVVISAKMVNSAVVLVERLWKHPLYQKTIKRSKKYLADNAVKAKEGDVVLMQETRPLSKRKNWKIVEVVAKR